MSIAAASPVDLQGTRALLAGLYLELTAEYEQAGAAVTGLSEPAEGDVLDAGSRAAEREQQLSLQASIRDRRDQVEHALQRLDRGEYGRCERCGGAITAERLAALPAATSCVRCPGRRR